MRLGVNSQKVDMTEIEKTVSATENVVTQTVALLTGYEFELKGYTADEIVTEWLNEYEAVWLRLAVIEALYQGRYKSISVEQILKTWLKRGNPNFHFNHEFERLICSKLPRSVAAFEENPLVQGYTQHKSVSKTSFSNQSDHLNPKLPQLNPVEYNPTSLLKSTLPSFAPVTRDCKAKESKYDAAEVEEEKGEIIKKEDKTGKQENSSPERKMNKDFISPIHQLTPKEDASRLYSKLKAVAHKTFDEDESKN